MIPKGLLGFVAAVVTMAHVSFLPFRPHFSTYPGSHPKDAVPTRSLTQIYEVISMVSIHSIVPDPEL